VTLAPPVEERGISVKMKQDYDAIVIGSGITGGWAAKELTELGLKTLVIERGRNVVHGTDYTTEHLSNHDFPFRGKGDRKLYESDYFVQKITPQFNEGTMHFFANDRQNPYTHDPETPYTWIRGQQLGGRSLIWSRQCYRWSELDFESNARDGFGNDWPIRYKDLAPWYDHVERFAGISGEPGVSPRIPHGKLLPAMPLNAAELKLRAGAAKHFPDRPVTVARVAVLTQALNGRAPCHYCGTCARGCSTGSYFSSLSATLPAARATGKLTVRTDSIVHELIYDEKKDKVTGVRIIDAHTHKDEVISARVVFVCASAYESVRLLLNSKTPRFSDGLGNSSGVLGHYLMDHHNQGGARGVLKGIKSRYYNGYRPCGIHVPRFRNIDKQHPDFVRGYQLGGRASPASWSRGITSTGIGAEFKHQLRDPGPWHIRISGTGETLPLFENYMKLDTEVKDAWGVPVPRFHVTWGDNERKMDIDVRTSVAEMLEASGVEDVEIYTKDVPPGHYIHEMGGARMGKDPKTSVLNAHNQCHDVSNVFVTDGACMASSANQNPSLTYMALTARACHHAVSELKAGNI